MKKNRFAWFSVLLTLVLLALLGVLLLTGTFSKGTATNPALPYETALFFIFLAVLGIWCVSGVLGWIMLSRRGFFADIMESLIGNEWVGCIAGIFLLAGLWMVAVLPGPYLMWFASTRQARLLCPKCKKWMPRGAVQCAHCGEALPGAPAEAPAVSQPAETKLETLAAQQPTETKLETPAAQQPTETNVEIPTEHQCENCKAVNPAGATYPIYYGTFAGSEYLGNQRTRYSFKIAGSKEIFLCNQCVTEYGKKQMQQRSLGLSLGLVAMVIGLSVCSLLLKVVDPGGANQTNMTPAVVFVVILAPLVYFWMQRQAAKHPLGQGDLLALKLCKPALKSQGYTRFYTRQQMHDNQLL